MSVENSAEILKLSRNDVLIVEKTNKLKHSFCDVILISVVTHMTFLKIKISKYIKLNVACLMEAFKRFQIGEFYQVQILLFQLSIRKSVKFKERYHEFMISTLNNYVTGADHDFSLALTYLSLYYQEKNFLFYYFHFSELKSGGDTGQFLASAQKNNFLRYCLKLPQKH